MCNCGTLSCNFNVTAFIFNLDLNRVQDDRSIQALERSMTHLSFDRNEAWWGF
jgi:hypothetical protein